MRAAAPDIMITRNAAPLPDVISPDGLPAPPGLNFMAPLLRDCAPAGHFSATVANHIDQGLCMLVGIREATVEDAQAIATIHVDSWQAAYRGILPETYLVNLAVAQRGEAWRKSLKAARPRVLVAHADTRSEINSESNVDKTAETILGWVAFGDSRDADKDHRWGEVETLYIAPAFWRKGIGGRLIDAARHSLQSAGYTNAALWVLLDNRRARAFYTRSGFVCDNSSRGVQLGGKWLTELRYCCTLDRTRAVAS